jgi:hypothetical protein
MNHLLLCTRYLHGSVCLLAVLIWLGFLVFRLLLLEHLIECAIKKRTKRNERTETTLKKVYVQIRKRLISKV